MTPTSIDIIKVKLRSHKGSCHPHAVSHLIAAYPQMIRDQYVSSLCLCSMHFLADVFALVFRSSESVHKPFMSKFSIHCSYVILGAYSLLIYKVSCFMGLVSAMKDLGAWCLMWSSNYSFLREYLYLCDCSQLWIAAAMVCIFLDQRISLPLLTVLMLSFYLFLWRLCSSNFQVPF